MNILAGLNRCCAPGGQSRGLLGRALLVLLLGVGPLPAAELPDQLQSRFTAPESQCRGWGSWQSPWVLVNSSTQAVSLAKGLISLPARSVAVHPGADRDVAVGWVSPLDGTVSVQAGLADAHPAGGDGVSWRLLHVTGKNRALLAEGLLERGATTLDKPASLAAVTVQRGDILRLVIGPRTGNACDSTTVAFTVTDTSGAATVWGLARDLSANVEINPQLWQLTAPTSKGATMQTLTRSTPAKPEPAVQSWTLATADTQLTLGLSRTGQLAIYQLGHPASDQNWTRPGSVLLLPALANGKAAPATPAWQFAEATTDRSKGHTVSLRFVCAQPALELKSVWSAQPGPGPIRHWSEIRNLSDAPVGLGQPDSLRLWVQANGCALWWVSRGGNNAQNQGGTFTEAVDAGTAKQFGLGPTGTAPVPWLAVQAQDHGLYLGWEYSGNGVMHAVADPAGAVLDCGFTLGEKQLAIPAGGSLWIPPAFVGCYRGDLDAASYSLHRFYLKHLRPALPAEYPDPMLTYNVFFGADKEQGLVQHLKLAQEFGFEAFVVDAIWFPGPWGSHKGPWIWDAQRYPNGVKPYREFTRQHQMLFGLWCAWGRNFDQAEPLTKQIIADNQLDYFKHDMGLIPGGSYARTVGYYQVMDALRAAYPRLVLENCDAGGCIKDFGAMSRAHYVVTTDDLSALPNRMSLYDSTFVFPPRVLQAYTWLRSDKADPYLWRSAMMGAWVLDTPPLAGAEAESVKKAVATYKSWIRPILQDCQVHHILPRPDGKNWDGLFYWGPQLKKGILFVFRPQSETARQSIKLKGLDPAKRYQAWSEDGSIQPATLTGAELMTTGLAIALPGPNTSDLIFLQEQP